MVRTDEAMARRPADLNEPVTANGVDESTAYEQVRTVMQCADETEPMDVIAERAGRP